MILRKNEGTYLETVIDGEAVLLGIRSGRFDGLKGTAFTIWNRIDGQCPLDAIKAELHAEYLVDLESVSREVDHFVKDMLTLEYITAV